MAESATFDVGLITNPLLFVGSHIFVRVIPDSTAFRFFPMTSRPPNALNTGGRIAFKNEEGL